MLRPHALHARFVRARGLLLPLCLAAVLSACAPAPVRNPIAQWVPSPNFDARRPVLIVIHFTNEHSAEQALHTLRTANSGSRENMRQQPKPMAMARPMAHQAI